MVVAGSLRRVGQDPRQETRQLPAWYLLVRAGVGCGWPTHGRAEFQLFFDPWDVIGCRLDEKYVDHDGRAAEIYVFAWHGAPREKAD